MVCNVSNREIPKVVVPIPLLFEAESNLVVVVVVVDPMVMAPYREVEAEAEANTEDCLPTTCNCRGETNPIEVRHSQAAIKIFVIIILLVWVLEYACRRTEEISTVESET